MTVSAIYGAAKQQALGDFWVRWNGSRRGPVLFIRLFELQTVKWADISMATIYRLWNHDRSSGGSVADAGGVHGGDLKGVGAGFETGDDFEGGMPAIL